MKNKAKGQKAGFLPVLLRTLVSSKLGSALTGRDIIRAGEGTIRECENF